jgi:hypothetical protein
MNLNEQMYFLIGCMSTSAFLWLCIKFRTRNLPSFEQALSLYGESSKNLALELEEQSEVINRMKADLIQEQHKLLEGYDEPDKTLH